MLQYMYVGYTKCQNITAKFLDYKWFLDLKIKTQKSYNYVFLSNIDTFREISIAIVFHVVIFSKSKIFFSNLRVYPIGTDATDIDVNLFTCSTLCMII